MSEINRATGLLVLEVVNSNPNGDPDRESDPRQRANGQGEISPVSFKRKLRDLVEVIQTSRRNVFPVLSDDDKFLGVIVLDDVRKIIFRPELYDTVIVDDLMHPMSEGDLVRNSDSLSDVVEKFRSGERYNLVVVDDDNNYLGFLSRANTFSAYRRFISDTSEE